MTGTNTSGQGVAGESTASTIKVDVQAGPGLATLLRGTGTSIPSRQTDAAEEAFENEGISNRTVLGLSLAAADLLLLGQSASLLFRDSPSVNFPEWVLTVIGVGLGGWLGCLAVLLLCRRAR